MIGVVGVWARELRGTGIGDLSEALRAVCGGIGPVLRQLLGAPDYQRYVDHFRARHPGVEPLGRDEFYRARLEDRYSKPGARCC